MKKQAEHFFFYDAYSLKKTNDKQFWPIVLANSEKELEEKMNAKLKKNPDKYKDYRLVSVYIQSDLDDIGKKNITV